MTNSIRQGKLIVIEGLDGTGKATQTKMLVDYLVNEKGMEYGKDVIYVDFPRYDRPSSDMVKHYLSGKFGANPDAINAYTASSFYSIDRAISFNTEKWGEVYRNGGLVILDRYTTANVIYQGAKMLNENMLPGIIFENILKDFVKWLNTYEYAYNGIPCPTAVIFLMMNKKNNMDLLHSREDTAVDGDIHEASDTYQDRCRMTLEQYKHIVEHDHLIGGQSKNVFINTNDEDTGELMSREMIHEKVKFAVDQILAPENMDDRYDVMEPTHNIG